MTLDQKIDKIFKGGECLSKATLKRRIKKLVGREIKVAMAKQKHDYEILVNTLLDNNMVFSGKISPNSPLPYF